MTPLDSAADLTESHRLLQLLDALSALSYPTMAYLSTATFPRAESVLRLWTGAQDPGRYYLEERQGMTGRMLDLRRKHDHTSIVTVAVLDATKQAQLAELDGAR